MYRCTECNTEYTECPDYCQCGNDTFVEVYEQEYYEPEPRYNRPSRPKRRELTPEEIEELEEERIDKIKALITIGVAIILTITVLFLPPYKQKKMPAVAKKVETANIKLPRVKSYWDNTVASPYRKQDPNWNLPILNNSFGTISPVLRDYLKVIGKDFTRLWDSNKIDGHGECKVEFTINREGQFGYKKISVRSYNESLDDSVLILLDKITGFEIPPDDYKGERIIIAFKIDKNGTSKVYYPMNSK